MKPKYLTKTDIQLHPNILRRKNNKKKLQSTRIMNICWLYRRIMFTTNFYGKTIYNLPLHFGYFHISEGLVPL